MTQFKTATKTPQTVMRYLHTAALLEQRARNKLALAPSQTLPRTDLIKWAIALRPDLSPASWRQYKAALSCSLSRQNTPDSGKALALLERADSGPCHSTIRNTSAQKARKLTPSDFKTIRDFLLQRNWKWSRPTAVWLTAGSLSGLRPAEWFEARLTETSDGAILLHLKNAKATNDRAHGPSRTLNLSDLKPNLLALIRRHLAFVAEFADKQAFQRAYIGCMKTLYRATRTLWPTREKYICLYTARHQFAADAKAAGLSRSEVAALLGHGSDRTAAVHYARRTSGQSGFRVLPDLAEVAGVRRKAESRAEFLARKARESTTTPSSQPSR